MDELRIEGTIAKLDADERQAFGWASITEINGEPVVDLQGDLLDTYELEKAAYDYVINSRVGGEMHDRIGKSAPKQIGTLIESMVITPEKIEKMGLPDTTPHGWWIGFQVDKGEAGDEAWTKLKDGKYTGFSIHGIGKRTPVEKRVLDRSEEEIAGWTKRVAESIGVEPRQLAKDLAAYMKDNDDPTDEDLHDFLMETYGSGQMLSKRSQAVDEVKKQLLKKAAQRSSSHEEFLNNIDEIAKAFETVDNEMSQYFFEVGKHLIGRHEQEDHDPTKKKRGIGHKRQDHGQASTGAKIGAGAGAALAGGLALAFRNPGALAATRTIGGAGAGASLGYNLGGGQFFGSREGSSASRRALAGTANFMSNPWGTIGRRVYYGDPNAHIRENQRRNARFTKRQIEILEKYLGEDAL
jgi:hypothetical protein